MAALPRWDGNWGVPLPRQEPSPSWPGRPTPRPTQTSKAGGELHAFPGGYCGLSAIESGLINVCPPGGKKISAPTPA